MMSDRTNAVTTGAGAEVTDEMFERLAGEWENDTWSGRLTDISVGRPRIMGEELVNVTFRIPKSRLTTIEAIAKRKGETRSEYLRDAVDKALAGDAS
jgi:hypothetical protein